MKPSSEEKLFSCPFKQKVWVGYTRREQVGTGPSSYINPRQYIKEKGPLSRAIVKNMGIFEFQIHTNIDIKYKRPTRKGFVDAGAHTLKRLSRDYVIVPKNHKIMTCTQYFEHLEQTGLKRIFAPPKDKHPSTLNNEDLVMVPAHHQKISVALNPKCVLICQITGKPIGVVKLEEGHNPKILARRPSSTDPEKMIRLNFTQDLAFSD